MCEIVELLNIFFNLQFEETPEKNEYSKKLTKLHWSSLCWCHSVSIQHLKNETVAYFCCFCQTNSDKGICPFKDKANFKCVGWNNSKQVEHKCAYPNMNEVNSKHGLANMQIP